MGLLDSLYGNQVDGLLSYLRPRQFEDTGPPSPFPPVQQGLLAPPVQQAQPQLPQQPLPPAFGGGNYLDRITNGGGLISSLFGDTGQQKLLTAQYQALIPIFQKAGNDEPTARSMAMLAVTDPEARKQLLTDQFGPGRFSMQMNEEGRPVVLDNKSGAVTYPGGGNVPGAAAPGQFGASAPLPPPPPGANTKVYRENSGRLAAENNADLQTRAEGAVQAIQNFNRLRERINAAPDYAFGPFAGSEWGQYGNAMLGGIPGMDKATDARKISEAQSELGALYKDVGSAMLKSRFGSRVTNIDTKIGQQIVGGLNQPNKETAIRTLDNNAIEAYNTLEEGIKRGVVDPRQVLARPQSAQEAKALGAGALYLAPDGSVRRNPK